VAQAITSIYIVFLIIVLVCGLLTMMTIILLRKAHRNAPSPWLKRIGVLDGVLGLQVMAIWVLLGAQFSGGQLMLFALSLSMFSLCALSLRRSLKP
jgi:RsiW-degrading membrane proteinase PrsW (M82 family)